ncbi:MAG: gamma-glutamyltransferase, partial [Bacteroidota bacterium]
MCKDTHEIGSGPSIASVGRRLRQFTVCALSAAVIAGCSSRPAPAPAAAAPPPGFFGAVAADEPQAALIGREILAAGGTAADAAIATYFAMAVTLPSQASLAGGGMCVSFNTATNEAQALEFLARPSSPAQSGGDRPTAIPGNIRGFFALHGVYGRLRWSQLLAPAENLARFGVPVSRALSTDLTQVESALAREPRMRRIFSAEGGRRMVADGDTLVQPDLAAVLASVRTSGPGDFYSGPLSVRFLQGVREAGGSLSREDLAYQPVWRKPLMVGFDDERAYFAPPPPAGGVIAGQTWAMLVKDDRFNRASPADRDALLVSAAGRAFADRRQWATGGADLQSLASAARVDTLLGGRNDGAATRAVAAGQPATENPAAATLVAIDGQGSAVACAVTLNSLFGTGRVAGDTGIVLASSPGQGGRGGAMLGPMVVIKPSGRE